MEPEEQRWFEEGQLIIDQLDEQEETDEGDDNAKIVDLIVQTLDHMHLEPIQNIENEVEPTVHPGMKAVWNLLEQLKDTLLAANPFSPRPLSPIYEADHEPDSQNPVITISEDDEEENKERQQDEELPELDQTVVTVEGQEVQGDDQLQALDNTVETVETAEENQDSERDDVEAQVVEQPRVKTPYAQRRRETAENC